LKKSENLGFYEQNKLIFWHLALQPLDNVSHVIELFKITRKLNFNLFQTNNYYIYTSFMEAKLYFFKKNLLSMGCPYNKQSILGLKEF
jgi:hypothetical protein